MRRTQQSRTIFAEFEEALEDRFYYQQQAQYSRLWRTVALVSLAGNVIAFFVLRLKGVI